MGEVFIPSPIFAIAPAIFYLGLFTLSRRISVVLAGLLWLAYLPHEYAMKLRILCSGEYNIRVDLLLIYPILLLVSVVAIVNFLRSRRKSNIPTLRSSETGVTSKNRPQTQGTGLAQ